MDLTISLPEGAERVQIAGAGERNLKIIREALGVAVTARRGAVRICGAAGAVERAAHVIEQLTSASRRQQPMTRQEVLETVTSTQVPPVSGSGTGAPRPGHGGMDVYLGSRRIRPRTEGQQRYLDAIGNHDLTFCVGPAGTGKTYLAVAAAVQMLKHDHARKLVLVRPAVEAGEKLGYLPGNMQEKVHPYLRPLLDALHDMMEFDQIQRFMAADVIEIVPLAFMRGRTLNDAVIILDEAQNTTKLQMLMFLTRLGHGSKMIVTGDISQIDLPEPRDSGLIDAERRLKRENGIAMITLDQFDIVRHRLVQRIVQAYGQEPTGPDAAVSKAGPDGNGDQDGPAPLE